MIIRAERPSDIAAIHAINAAAFGQPAEAELVDALRRDPAHWIPELSLVAEENGDVVGFLLFTRVAVRAGAHAAPALALAPLAVLPAHHARGIGSALMREGLSRARSLGHGVVILLGHATYYPRFGFVPAAPHGIRYPGPVPEESFMVAELIPGTLANVSGVVEYAPAFSDL